MNTSFYDFDLNIARTRCVLSLIAAVSLYVDPTTAGGLFHLTAYALLTLLLHLAYSVTTYLALKAGVMARHLPAITTALDLLFATAIACLTEGQTSPSYVFFVFAILASGIRSRPRLILRVTLCGVTLYLLVVGLSHGLTGIYIMRAVYLAIAGYLVGVFEQQRTNYEDRLRQLEGQAERHAIARLLHDSYVQSLAGVNLRLEACRELLRRGSPEDASNGLEELQTGVARQYDEVREYLRSLAGVDPAFSREINEALDPGVEVRAVFSAPSWIAERVLQIVMEGLRNARKHAQASLVKIDAIDSEEKIVIKISDDGVGFPPAANPPWTIASHVAESGGQLNVNRAGPARLEIEMPKS